MESDSTDALLLEVKAAGLLRGSRRPLVATFVARFNHTKKRRVSLLFFHLFHESPYKHGSLGGHDSVAVSFEAEDARFLALSEREARMAHSHQIAGID